MEKLGDGIETPLATICVEKLQSIFCLKKMWGLYDPQTNTVGFAHFAGREIHALWPSQYLGSDMTRKERLEKMAERLAHHEFRLGDCDYCESNLESYNMGFLAAVDLLLPLIESGAIVIQPVEILDKSLADLDKKLLERGE